MRMSSVVVALALTAATLLLVQHRAEAAPAGAPVAAAIAAPAVAAQINVAQLIASIVCPILVQIRSAFSRSPFFGFALPIFTQLLVAFGCQPSG